MKQVKMIWDFRGPTSQQTAAHHVIHLKEFLSSENIEDAICDMEVASPHLTMAFLIVPETLVPSLRSRLKPHRGQWFQPTS